MSTLPPTLNNQPDLYPSDPAPLVSSIRQFFIRKLLNVFIVLFTSSIRRSLGLEIFFIQVTVRRKQMFFNRDDHSYDTFHMALLNYLVFRNTIARNDPIAKYVASKFHHPSPSLRYQYQTTVIYLASSVNKYRRLDIRFFHQYRYSTLTEQYLQ